MKNLILVISFIMIVFSSLPGYCQKTALNLGGELAFPHAEGLIMVAGTGFGGSIRVERSWGRHFSGMATAGYLWFEPKKDISLQISDRFKALPFQVGVKYYPLDKTVTGLFFSTELGLMVMIREVIFQNPDFNIKQSYPDISVAPGIGYQLGNFEPSFRLQFNLSDVGYNIYYLNFRIAYTILKSKN